MKKSKKIIIFTILILALFFGYKDRVSAGLQLTCSDYKNF